MSGPAPPPPALIADWTVTDAAHETWPPGGQLYHSHHRDWAADSFNGTPNPRVRFSPIRRDGPPDPTTGDAPRVVVPAWYAGSTDKCAVAESLFHDIPMSGGEVVPARYEHRRVSVLRPTRTLRLLQLDTDGIRALDLDTWVYDCEAIEYEETERLAQGLYDRYPAIDGLVWMSKRRNADTAVVLYENTDDAAHPGGTRPGDLTVDPHPVLDFDRDDDWEWLRDYGKSIRIDVL